MQHELSLTYWHQVALQQAVVARPPDPLNSRKVDASSSVGILNLKRRYNVVSTACHCMRPTQERRLLSRSAIHIVVKEPLLRRWRLSYLRLGHRQRTVVAFSSVLVTPKDRFRGLQDRDRRHS